MKQIKYILISESGQSLSIDSFEALNFLARSRRSAEPKWYHKDPDFQSYYGYYSSIGHVDGVRFVHLFVSLSVCLSVTPAALLFLCVFFFFLNSSMRSTRSGFSTSKCAT